MDHRLELRLWLRLLATSSLIEAEVRQRLRARFGTTLPRFDLLAQLERVEDGLLLGELSRRMMVSNGNVTGLVERLAEAGLIERSVPADDRRAVRVRLTEQGRAAFAEMASAHAEWISELFAGLNENEQEALWSRLKKLKTSVLTATKHPRAAKAPCPRLPNPGRARRVPRLYPPYALRPAARSSGKTFAMKNGTSAV
jgi:DNA-binding MarR family transcriptional regulator